MQCPQCRHENPRGAKFCVECASPIARHCPACGTEAAPTAKFCPECAAPLTPTPYAAPQLATPPQPPAPTADGERRQLTVLFCDLVGSTEIASQLDPEDWHRISKEYQQVSAAAVTRFGGHVDKFLGDGLVCFFGVPIAHEDDAERAVRAGLAIVEQVSGLRFQVSGADTQHPTPDTRLHVRVGMHTGSAVVAYGGGESKDVFGETPNIAARVQSAAEPDTVMITAATQRLVAGLFVVEDRGAQQLKGIERPVQLYRVTGAGMARRRTRAHGLTPFVGREDELRLLLGRWERVREGEGQFVLILGEPGIGKSRLLEEFCTRLTSEPHLWIECAGKQLFETTPFHAVTQMLAQGLGWRGDESEEVRVSQLERALAAGLTRDYDVSLSVIRGYVSLSFAHGVAETWNQITKPITAYYLGDFDPSGLNLEADLREKLAD